MAGPERVRKAIASNLQSTIRDLQRRKARGRRGLALIEGVRLVEEALAAGLTFRGALVTPDLARTTRGRELAVELERHAVSGEGGAGGTRACRRAVRRHDVMLRATAADGAPVPRAVEAGGSGPIAVIVGNEGAGIRPQLNAVSAKRVAIPLSQGAESLNVAVAAGILLFEVTRGR